MKGLPNSNDCAVERLLTSFKLRDFQRERRIRCQYIAKLNERSRHKHAHLHCSRAVEDHGQVHLLRKLREFCRHYNCNILFTTHSLAMMRTLDASELMYMERRGTEIVLSPASYSYIKTLLFGFTGWDRYILTEDRVLHGFVEFIIRRYCTDVFYQYKIIYVGGGSQVSDLMRRNQEEHFLSEPDNVLAILDGDQRGADHARQPKTYFLPIESVEKALLAYYTEENFPFRLAAGKGFSGAKDLFNSLQRDGVMSITQIYGYICERNEQSIGLLAVALNGFLSRSPGPRQDQ